MNIPRAIPTKIPKIVFLASGNGSNCEAIWSYLKENNKVYEGTLICNRPQAFVLQRAQKYKIPSKIIADQSFVSPELYQQALKEALQSCSPDYIVCAGYLKILALPIIELFADRIVNIHPSLLPSFKGLQSIKKAWAFPVKITGITIHLVNEDLDAGKILLQKSIEIKEGETLESVTQRIHELEHQHYPPFIANWCFG